MKDMVKRYPMPALFTATTFLLVGAEAYVGYQNMDYVYKKLELEGTKELWVFLLASYGTIALTILAVLVSFKLVDCLWYERVSPPNFMKISWWWVLGILPSPLYALAMLSFEEGYNATINNLFTASVGMFLISCLYTVKTDIKRAIFGKKDKE
ncbi:hypothetical protein [Bacillus thuringiensis]|uniref:hypothetical protein n=1 Tax=Bacillus thuringiensis TaxID=1428 RepID=UPI000BFB52BE|nr:hypothetical protein [Bacillus thuringiensis]PGT90066.1 hypothetical protein COD17_09965 [Bacillus thuringiensis]